MQEKNDPMLDEEPKKKQQWPETGKQGGETHDDIDKGGDLDDSEKKREGVDVGEDKP